MSFAFWKMHGAGNDFIIIDDREKTFPADNRARIQSLSTRRRGIGADGVVLIQPSDTGDVRMRFFNPDGHEAELCGNAARCMARLAHERGAAPREMLIETMAGGLRAEVLGDRVRLEMPEPTEWTLASRVDVLGQDLRYGMVNTGVPHVVVEWENLPAADLVGIGGALRRHTRFAPAGTNVNLVAVTGARSLDMRTYERGVEGETLACGTGAVAAALVEAAWERVQAPVAVTCAGGDVLDVAFSMTNGGASDVHLTGGAEHVFQGTLDA